MINTRPDLHLASPRVVSISKRALTADIATDIKSELRQSDLILLSLVFVFDLMAVLSSKSSRIEIRLPHVASSSWHLYAFQRVQKCDQHKAGLAPCFAARCVNLCACDDIGFDIKSKLPKSDLFLGSLVFVFGLMAVPSSKSTDQTATSILQRNVGVGTMN